MNERGLMVNDGKTFKGLTDATLAWQTGRFLELETHPAEADTLDSLRLLLTARPESPDEAG